eukprot:6214151-Pleurochrysis_carterae.AAC.4
MHYHCIYHTKGPEALGDTMRPYRCHTPLTQKCYSAFLHYDDVYVASGSAHKSHALIPPWGNEAWRLRCPRSSSVSKPQ